MRSILLSGILAVFLSSCSICLATICEVPFADGVPRITKKLCSESLHVNLLSEPVAGASSVWRDESGEIQSTHFVLDAGWDRLVYWHVGESEVRAFGQSGSDDGQFRTPGGIDVDRSGRLFVADRLNGRLVQLAYDFGTGLVSFVRNIATIGSVKLQVPADVRFDDNGTPGNPDDDHLWIVDPGQSAVIRMEVGDRSLGAIYGEGAGDRPGAWFDRPVGVAVGQTSGINNHTVYVVDQGLGRVIKLDDSLGRVVWCCSRELPGRDLVSVSTDYFGTVYVVDAQNSQVVCLDPDLNVTGTYFSQGVEEEQLNQPRFFFVARGSFQGFAIEKWADSSGFRMYTVAGGINSMQVPTLFFDATHDSLQIQFDLGDTARVTLRAEGGDVIWSNRPLSAGSHTFWWNGKRQDGTLELPGQYRLFLEAEGLGTIAWQDIKACSCVVRGTTVSGSVSGNWAAQMEPIVLAADATVDHYSSLCIDPGVRVMSSGKFGITVKGSLCASGDSLEAVTFAPYRRTAPEPDTVSPGSWQGVRIEDYPGANCLLDHCIIEYAGNPVDGDSAAIVCKRSGGLSLTNSVVRYSSTRGFWARSSINNNNVLLRGDTFEHIAGYPASVLAESVSSVVNSCTFRNNSNPALDVQVSTNHSVDQSASWLCCEPGWRYDIDGQLYVYKPYGPSCCSLMVGAGATIRMGKNHKLEIGSSSALNRTGYLGAWSQGERITFTSLNTLDSDNWWKGIQVSENSQAWMESCYVNCSQEVGLKGDNDALLVPDFCEFRKSPCGLASVGAQIYATGCRFVQNDTGMKFSGTASGPSYIMGCLVEDNTSYGLCALDDQEVRVYTTTFNNNNIPVRIRANLVYRPLLDSNYFQDNTWHGIEIGSGSNAGRIDDYACWTASPYISTYRCLTDLQVRNPSFDDGGEVQPPIAPIPDLQPENTRASVRGGMQSVNSNVQNANSLPIPGAQHEDAKARSRLGFASGGKDFNYQHVPTPMEWARAHGVGEDCLDSLLPVEHRRTGTQDGRAESQMGLGVRGQTGSHEAPLPQAGGGKGSSLTNWAALGLTPGCTLEFAAGAYCLEVGYGDFGALIASGEPNNKVTFRCATANSQWDGIHLKSYADQSVLKHCRILNAGHSAYGGVSFQGYNPRMQRCEIAYCQHRGVYINNAAPTITGCNIHDCDTGVYIHSANNSQTASFDTCRIAANIYGIRCSSYPRATFHHCDIDSNSAYGAWVYRSSLDCAHCWWGASNGPNPPGSGDHINANVSYSSYLGSRVAIEPPLDVSAIGLYPTGTYNQDSLVVNPQGHALNSYDEVLTIPTRMTVGSNYSQDQSIGLAGGQSNWLAFPAITLHRGTYRVVYKTMLTGDETPANDSIVDSVTVGALRDVSARRVVQPAGAQYNIVDTVPFAVMVANNFDSTLTIPVKLWRNDTLRETLSVALQPHDSGTVWFDSCKFDTGVYHVTYATCLANDAVRQNDTVRCQFSVGPAKDAAARFPISPVGVIVSDTPYVVTPTGWVRNNYDDTLTVPVRMRIGGSCVRDTHVFLAHRDSALVSFAPCTLSLGSYLVSLVTYLTGDQIPANDSIGETLLVRRARDVAITRVLAPTDSVYTIEDAISPGAMVANLWGSTLTVPVKLFNNDTLLEQQEVVVPGLDSVAVWFNARSLRHGNHALKFIACLDSDERRWNDTLVKSIRVKAGDYWVRLDSAPVAQARLATDSAGRVYAAARSVLRVDFYDSGSDLWNRLSNPPVSGVYGITAIDSTVYVLGMGMCPGLGQGNGPQGKEGSTAGSQGDKPQGGTTQILTLGPGIWRYEPENDSWLFVTDCGSTVLLGTSSNLVGTHDRTIYVVGCGLQTFRYFLTRDSWATVPSAPLINRWGAAGWMDRRLYALASSTSLVRYDEATGQWPNIQVPAGNGNYSSALCCDRAAERVFTFYDPGKFLGAGPGNSSPPMATLDRLYELRDTGPSGQPVWTQRASLASEVSGSALCFGATEGYCLDGGGGFWRYRPEPLYDLSVVGLIVPESAHADTSFTPHVIVQNNWQDSLSFTLTMHADSGGGYQAPGFVLPGRTRRVLSMSSMALPPGLRTVFVDLSMTGSDSVPANNHATGTVHVPLRHDAAAVQIFGVSGGVRYDSLLHPGGVVSNLWSDSLTIRVMLAVDSVYLESTTVWVPAQHSETVWFDTCRLGIGTHYPKLGVGIMHDEQAQNDTLWTTVNVVGNGWLTLHSPPPQNPVLCDGADSLLYAADRYGAGFNEYNMLRDTWRSRASASVMGMLSLSRVDDKVFGLGDAGTSGCIMRYRINNNSWSTVKNSLPVSPGDACGLVARDTLKMYLVGPGWTGNFWRYDVVGDSWHTLTSMPAGIFTHVSCAWDRSDSIYVLTGPSKHVYRYSISANTWTSLTTLPQSMNASAALSLDVQRKLLPAMGGGMLSTSQSAEFSLPAQVWSNPVNFPGLASHPSLTVSNGRLFGAGGGSATLAAFAEYVRVVIDAAALDIVSLPDTFRSDSLPHPGGVVRNLSYVPITCQVTLSCGASQKQAQVQLAPMQYDTVWFNALDCPPGVQTVSLTVSCTGDVNPGNDVYSKQVFVRAPWVPRRARFAHGRLDSDSNTVFAADAQTDSVMWYYPALDSWQPLRRSPLQSGHLDIGYLNNHLYVIGAVTTDRAKGQARVAKNKSGQDVTSYKIYKLALGDTTWQTVCESLPDSTSPGWLIPTTKGLYVLPASGNKLVRFDSATGWAQKAPVPYAVVSSGIADWDRNDTIFFSFTSDLGVRKYLHYSLTRDTWLVLGAPPESGMALAVEPGGTKVLMTTLDSLGSALFEHATVPNGWSRSSNTPPETYAGMALCFAGSDAWLLTGGPTQGSSFWRYDPDFGGSFDRKGGLGGTAGWSGQLQHPCLTCEPNPFNQSCRITYALPRPGNVCLKLYDVTGRHVMTLADGYTAVGNHVTNVSSRGLANGIYLLKLESADYKATRKLILE